MHTLYLTDLDGTLLGAQGQLSDTSARALCKLYDHGAMISIATGRSWTGVELLRGIPFRAPFILLNGARIYDAQTKSVLSEHTLSIQDAIFTLDLFKAHGLSPMVNTQDERDAQCIYYEQDTSDAVRTYVANQHAQGDHRFMQVDTHTQILHQKLFFITARGEAAALTPLVGILRARGLSAYLYYGVRQPDSCFIECSAATKRRGVEELRRITGAQRVVAYGDNGNDEELLRAADYGCAVQNATDALKRLAHCVIGAHDTDAVVRSIMEMEGIAWTY